jgi:hypothetical protein
MDESSSDSDEYSSGSSEQDSSGSESSNSMEVENKPHEKAICMFTFSDLCTGLIR